ncbi:hemin-degrading factor [Rhizobium albus]|nr:hemin-degrading factor [Rhizobium albus]
MSAVSKPSAEAIRQARAANPSMRERDLAHQLAISEAEFVAAWCGDGVRRIEPDVGRLLAGIGAVGEVMALTRNEDAVHEKIGVYENMQAGAANAIVLGKDIDLRIFPKQWSHGFAVEKRDGTDVKRSLQFFDAAGDAVHKIHLRPASDVVAYEKLVDALQREGDEPVAIVPRVPQQRQPRAVGADAVRERWSAMTDPHQFFGLLRTLKLERLDAVDLVGPDFAWPLEGGVLQAMFDGAVAQQIPIMCFVGNRGCIQIHSGPITTVKPMGPWINVMDPTFHLHLRADRVCQLWAVRKPTKEGHVTSLEAYDARGELIIQFFGKRHEGEDERGDWRQLVETMPRLQQSIVA